MITGSKTWAPALSTKFSEFKFANIQYILLFKLPRLMESFIEIVK